MRESGGITPRFSSLALDGGERSVLHSGHSGPHVTE
jgi:hypothetical protein